MIISAREFEHELEVFRTEGDAAVQFFFAWQTVNAVAGKDQSIYSALNRAPMFWNTSLGALQTATLITLGRVFDPDPKNYSVTRLLSIAERNLALFSKEALAERKRKLSANADEWLAGYLQDVYVPDREDFKRLKRYVAVRRRSYEEKYRPLRHQIFAHRNAMNSICIADLIAKTNTRELQQLLVFLRRMHEALWQLFFNGNKPVLRTARFSVNQIREQPSPSYRQKQLQERVINETEQLLRSLG